MTVNLLACNTGKDKTFFFFVGTVLVWEVTVIAMRAPRLHIRSGMGRDKAPQPVGW